MARQRSGSFIDELKNEHLAKLPLIGEDGSVYTGEWKEGKRHGQGTFVWADGSQYVGKFPARGKARPILAPPLVHT